MSLSMYQASVPPMLQLLNTLSATLDKAVAHCEARKIDPAKLLTCRLALDMHPLSAQVQLTSDLAKNCVARLSGVDNPSMPDTETTIDELKGRIAKTIAFLKSVRPDQIDGTEDKEIIIKVGPQNEITLKGSRYLLHFIQPNFYFHITTAYDILRHAGVEIGKRDFIGAFWAD